MNFCPQCGSKNEANCKFCTSCGNKLVEKNNDIENTVTEPIAQQARIEGNSSNIIPPQRFTITEFAQNIRNQYPKEYDDLSDSQLVNLWVKKYPNDQEKIIFSTFSPSVEKKTNNHWYWIGGILIVIAAISSYVLYQDSKYPKSENELTTMLCDKFWKPVKYEVKEIYLNGKLIDKPTDNVVKNLQKAVDGNDASQIYSTLQNDIDKRLDKNDFFIYKKLNNNSYWKFNLSYNHNFNRDLHSEIEFNIENANSKYLIKYIGGQIDEYSTYEEGEQVHDSLNFLNYNEEILSIDKDNLKLSEEMIIVDKNGEFKFVFVKSCLPVNPKPEFIKLYKDCLEFRELLNKL